MKETDSDDQPPHENSYRLNNQDKAEIFQQIKEEMCMIEEPREVTTIPFY